MVSTVEPAIAQNNVLEGQNAAANSLSGAVPGPNSFVMSSLTSLLLLMIFSIACFY